MTKDEKQKSIAVIFLYTDNNKILLQDRTGISRHEEEWSFFGGGIEEGETPKQAIVREIKEELNYTLTDFKIFFIEQRKGHSMNWFMKNIAVDLDKLTVLEGAGMKLFTIPEAKSLKLMNGQLEMINQFEKFLKQS